MSPQNHNTNTDILLAGAFAALTIDLLVYPLDTIKTRIQAPDYKKLYTNPATGAAQRSLFRGLYQGIGSVVLATVPSSGAFFTTYEGTKSLLHRVNEQLGTETYRLPTPFIHSVASATGEVVSCFILTPAEVLKQNAQVIKKSASESSHIFDMNATRRALQKFKRPTQLWSGYTALVARNLPFTAVQFPMFEHLKQNLLDRRSKSSSNLSLLERGVVTGVAAGISGSVSAVITTPIDVVKTRIMLSAGKDSADAKAAMKQLEAQGKDINVELKKTQKLGGDGRPSAWSIGSQVWKTEGLKGLFRGGALRAVWTALGSGLYLSVYESGRSYLESRRETQPE